MLEDKGIVIPIALEDVADAISSEDLDNDTLIEFVLSLSDDYNYPFQLLNKLIDNIIESNEEDNELNNKLKEIKSML